MQLTKKEVKKEEISEKLDRPASNEGGEVQAGGLERPGMYQPSPLRTKDNNK